MLAAVKEGDAKELAELMRQDPGFKVNMDLNEYGYTLLHYACSEDSSSNGIPLLLAHPDIDVNVKNNGGRTPFYWACYGHTSCVREMLKDSRVKLNEPTNSGETPLWIAARYAPLDTHQVVDCVWEGDGSRETRGCRQDGCHWGGKESWQDRSGDPAGEIQE